MPVSIFLSHRSCLDYQIEAARGLDEYDAKHIVDMFYVGHQGQCDAMVQGVLRELRNEYLQISYIVLAYISGRKPESEDY